MLTGSCLCGAIAYQADADLKRIVHCHCQTCRKTHGAAFSSVTAVPQVHIWRTDGASWYDPKASFPELPQGLA